MDKIEQLTEIYEQMLNDNNVWNDKPVKDLGQSLKIYDIQRMSLVVASSNGVWKNQPENAKMVDMLIDRYKEDYGRAVTS